MIHARTGGKNVLFTGGRERKLRRAALKKLDIIPPARVHKRALSEIWLRKQVGGRREGSHNPQRSLIKAGSERLEGRRQESGLRQGSLAPGRRKDSYEVSTGWR